MKSGPAGAKDAGKIEGDNVMVDCGDHVPSAIHSLPPIDGRRISRCDGGVLTFVDQWFRNTDLVPHDGQHAPSDNSPGQCSKNAGNVDMYKSGSTETDRCN